MPPKLHEVPDGTKIRVRGEIKVPPAAPLIEVGEILHFNHIDGMYSHCIDIHGNVVHLVAWADVEIVDED